MLYLEAVSCWYTRSPVIEAASQLSVEVLHVTYHNPTNGWSVLKVRDLQSLERETAVGVFSTIHPGESYRFFGTWTTHASFGKQFKVARAVELLPHTESGIKRYLASGLYKGMGPKTADRIVDHFGVKALEILNERPDRLTEVPKISLRLAKKIALAWKERQQSADILLFLCEHGIPNQLSQKIAVTYGDRTIKILTQNPYQLIDDFRGVGFLTADKLARALGCAPDSLFRLQAGIRHLLSQGEDRGHCYQLAEQLRAELQPLLGLSNEQIEAQLYPALVELEQRRTVVHCGDAYYRAPLYHAELQVTLCIQRMLATPLASELDTPEALRQKAIHWLGSRRTNPHQVQISQHQSEAILHAACEKIFILTGGPGVGKTTTVRTMIEFFQSLGRHVLLAAPTGRAAQRLSEISPIPAKTVHRLLEWAPGEGNFARNADNPLQADIAIIDESSMLDITLASSLLQALPPTCQLILIGDVDQLPAVGPGNFLSDLIQSRQIPCLQLTEIFRQAAASQIVQVAHTINHGKIPTFDSPETSDCLFLQTQTPQEIIEHLHTWIHRILRERGFDPARDVQVLTPMNRGPLGSLALNQEIQSWLNPKPAQGVSREFQRNGFVLRTGDKVIQMVNNYENGVFNGDIGFVEHAQVENGKLIVSFQNRQVQYDAETMNELTLAYAVSIHKSQGSEFPVVLIPVSMQHYIMLQRNLFYTGLTRGKKLVVFIGEPRALAYAIRNQESRKRQTKLESRVRGMGRSDSYYV